MHIDEIFHKGEFKKRTYLDDADCRVQKRVDLVQQGTKTNTRQIALENLRKVEKTSTNIKIYRKLSPPGLP